ncbi:MAG: MerR family transcriptional regulator [bacterium]
MNNYLTAGEFAKLARTTKRTILFYDEKDILKPFQKTSNKYRFYKSEQILDFQIISLMRRLGLSLEDISGYLKENYSLHDIFQIKKKSIEEEINFLNNSLINIDEYNKNLEETGFIIKPEIKTINPYEIYYIVRKGSYAGIKDFCFELKNYFSKISSNATFLTIFIEHGYNPKDSEMKIGVIKNEVMELNDEGSKKVKSEKFPLHQALTYTYKGSGSLLSIHWKYLEEYQAEKGIKDNVLISPRELYLTTSLNGERDENKHIFEIQIPVNN